MENTLAPRTLTPPLAGIIVFALIALGGLFYVKWFPYYERAFSAAAHHSIGNSILMGSAAQAPEPSLAAAIDYALAYGKAIWKAMVLGLLLGSGVQALLPQRWIARLLGSNGMTSVAAGALLSLPGMMCTCCAAPVVAGLRRCRASPGAALSFWLGNSVLNPATLVFIGFVLGWDWAALRVSLGLLMVMGLGYLVNRLETSRAMPLAGIGQEVPREVEADAQESRGPFSRWLAILARMSLRLLPEYLVLVLLLGFARAWLFPQIGPVIDNSLLWILAFACAGALFVIPTAGEVPIIQAMLVLGMSAGPAGALLMTLPPISLPSVAMLGRSFTARTLVVVAGGVVIVGFAAGLLAIALGLH